MSPTTDDEVVTIAFSTLKPHKSAGFDCIKPDIVREVIHTISRPLCHIINLSFTSGIVLDNLKMEKVIPIYKKGDPNDFYQLSSSFCIDLFLKNI